MWRMTIMVFSCFVLASLITLFVVWILIKTNLPNSGTLLYLVFAFCASCIIGTVFTAIFYRRSSNTYKLFKRAISEVANGNFDIVLPEGKDILSKQISKDFNIMVKELRSVQILKSEFISNFSHELKTPITSINGFSELLLADDITEDERKEYAKIIYDESARLLNLAKNTLLLSKLEGQIISDKKVFSLDAMVENCLLLMEKQLTEKNIALKTEFDKVTYYWDSNLLSQIVINLVSNAIKYNKYGGEIEISLKTADDKVIFKVSDTGIGMDESTIAKIFDRYYQADSSHKTEGNGLGLSIVERIVCLCEGKIDIESQVGIGSCFTVTLPMRKINNI